MCWLDENCDRCVKSYKPLNGEMPDYNVTQKLVNLGRECKLKFALDYSMVTGELPTDIALQIGYTEQNGFPESCMLFSDDKNDGYKTPPRKPKDAPDGQMCLPFAINDIVMTEQLQTA